MNGKSKLFVSYASEDRETIARPIAEALREKFDIWYDEFSLVMGDSLRKKIDEGLARCDFGIVILSKNFFKKNWPQMELNALVSRESSGGKAILPIWHDVTRTEVERFSPLLADRIGILSSRAIDEIVREIEKAIQSEQKSHAIKEKTKNTRRDDHLEIIEDLVAASESKALYSKILKRNVSRAAVNMLDDIHKIEADDRRPDHAELYKALKARYPNISEDTIDDALPMIMRLIVKHRLVVLHHDSGGYPYWNSTEKGIAVLGETRNEITR